MEQLDLQTLVERAQVCLDEGDYSHAILYLRNAMRRAPLRQDLREMLTLAVEGGSERAFSPTAPQPVPRVPRAPLFEEDRYDEDEDERVEFEPVEPMDERGAPPPVPGEAFDAPRRHEAPPSAYTPRQRRAPTGARVLGALMALGMIGAMGAGVAYLFMSGGDTATVREKQEAQLTRQNDRVTIDKAREYEKQNQFSKALEQLELLSDSPEKRRLLAEHHGNRGDYSTKGQRYNEARNAYQKALEYDPKSPQFAYDLGKTFYILGRRLNYDREAALEELEQSEFYLTQSMTLGSTNPAALYALADVENARGDQVAAHEYLRAVIREFSESREASKARTDLESMGLRAD